jgi:hypothetical protein
MKRAGVFALIFLAAGAAAATAAGRHTSAPNAGRCGGELWRLKTFSDLDRGKVDLNAQPTTIGAIRERKGPGRVPRRRTTPFQLHAWDIAGQVTAFKLDPTGAIRLQLYDDGAYLDAVIPSPTCLSGKSRDRADIAAAWRAFTAKCGKATPSWQSFGAVLAVSGVGFWSGSHPLRGAAPNGAELHPVIGLRVVAGC